MAYRSQRDMRTKIQIEANALDLEVFRLRQRLDEFAKLVNSGSLAMDAMHLGRARQLIWHHMHPKDREAINVDARRSALTQGE